MKKLDFFVLFVTILIGLTGRPDAASAQNSFYKVFAGSEDDVGNYVGITHDGGFIIAGKTNSQGNGDYDVWLIRTDAAGNTIWEQTYGDTDKDVGMCVQPTSDGGFVVAVNSIKPGHFNNGWIFKTDANGLMKWDYKFGGNNPGDMVSFVLPLDDGTCIVSGTVNSKSFVAKLDSAGHAVWSQSYFSNNASIASSMCFMHDSLIAVGGSFEFPANSGLWYPNLFYIHDNGDLITQLTWTNFPGGTVSFVSTCSDGGVLMGGHWNDAPSLIRMNGSGTYGLEYSFPLTGSGFTANGSVQDSDSTYIVCGNWYSGAMFSVNEKGEQLWSRYGRINGDDVYYNAMQKVDDNHLIFTGYNNEGDVNHDLILVKTTISGSMTGVKNNNNKLPLMQNSPNPFSETTGFTFTLLNQEHVKLVITDISGKVIKVLANKSYGAGEHKIYWNGITENGQSSPDGVYLATLKSGSGLIQTIKIVKRTVR